MAAFQDGLRNPIDSRTLLQKEISSGNPWMALLDLNDGNGKNMVFRIFVYNSVFQGFSKAKSANGGSILSLSQFLILPQLPQKIKLTSKVVKVDSKIIISLPKI
jgi:hypothetical protein